MPLMKPSTSDSGDLVTVREVSRDEVFSTAINPSTEPPGTDFRKPEWMGKIFLINAPGKVGKRGMVTVDVNGITYNTYSPDSKVRDQLRKKATSGLPLSFYGQLNVFNEEWQFFLPKGDWIQAKPSDKN